MTTRSVGTVGRVASPAPGQPGILLNIDRQREVGASGAPLTVRYRKERLLVAAGRLPARGHPRLAAPIIAVLVAAVLLAFRLSHVPETADLMYLPISLAAWWFGVPGGAAVGIGAGLAVAIVSPGGGDGGDVLGAIIFVVLGVLGGMASSLLLRRFDQLEQLSERLEGAYENAMTGMVSALELRDPPTAGHSGRVALNAAEVARLLGERADEVATVYWAGMLHDVGKIAVPEAILKMAGPLTPDERVIIERHAPTGANLISLAAPDLGELAELVRHHHERWDGRGYPDGLAGEMSPLGSRVLHVVDVFDALTSARPYRAGVETQRAVDYLLAARGTEFDPRIVDAFVALFADDAIVFLSGPCQDGRSVPMAVPLTTLGPS